MAYINTEKFSEALRKKGVDLANQRVLVTNFNGSEQSKDLTLPPNCGGFGRIHHFIRRRELDWPVNPLPIDPALYALGLPPDDKVQVQVFQNAVCSWRCWYCFVDFDLLSANQRYAEFKNSDELLALYLHEESKPPIIDLSGGQPDLVPEWTLWFRDAIYSSQLENQIYLWSDDNLSNDYLWRFLNPQDIRRLAESNNYGRVGCFKGFDAQSFSFNTKAEPSLFNTQFDLMRRLVSAGFDVYGYATFTSDDDRGLSAKMSDFMERLQLEVHDLFPLRTIPLKIYPFTPTKQRMQQTHKRALEIQASAIQAWSEELDKRFSKELRDRPIYEHRLRT